MWVYRYGEISHTPAVSKDLFMLYKDLESTGENLYHPHPLCRVRYVKRLEKENDKCGTGSRMPE